MARSFLVFLVIALAALHVVVATYYCDRPKCPSYGGCKPYRSQYAVGSRIYFYCKDGYSVYGSSYAKCLYSKSYRRTYWSHKPPVCKPRVRQCPRLTLDYGFVKHTGFKPGDKAVHFCDKYFDLVGDKVRYCQKNGYWTGKPPVCKPQVRQCPKLRLDYGFVKHTGFKPGDKASHFCNKCFKLVGDKVRYCQKNGYWTGKPPVCKIIDCGKPPTPDYGKVIFKSTKCGSKAFHICDRGFVLVGDKFRKCLPNGYWSGQTPKCVPIKKKY